MKAASGSDQLKKVGKAKKASKKSAKARKSKSPTAGPEDLISETVRLHYIIDRRDFLEKVKSVYAHYAA